MTALAKNIQVQERAGNVVSVPVAASTHIYKGAIVALDANGRAVAAADTAGLDVIGIAMKEADNSSGAAAAINVEVGSERAFLLTGSGFAQSDLGAMVFAQDDQTVELVASSTNGNKVGRIIQFVSATKVWVYIPSGGYAAGLADGTYSANETALINQM